MHDLSKYQQNANKEHRGVCAEQMDTVKSGGVLQVLLHYRHNTNARACWEMMGSQGESPSCTVTFPFTGDTAEQMLNV